ncbi:MAG: AbrB/MazE/SpoVT family DNA-binding domain-containing protein [Betaproteobacteria bacterium]|nr:AbrB/MazE/SpoVT family DNA-binding domain-containing protein [Betaproteobacteria bacterium]MCL2887294.1 AbrB/MazE/SpoVT family DNA-binding domain-containing protein [Betaproteobacteria bacterium]
MRLNIQKWGNSAAVRLPSAMLAQLGAKVGDTFEVEVAAESAVLRVARPRYKLADLLAQCDQNAPPPNLEWWDNAKPVGEEVW